MEKSSKVLISKYRGICLKQAIISNLPCTNAIVKAAMLGLRD